MIFDKNHIYGASYFHEQVSYVKLIDFEHEKLFDKYYSDIHLQIYEHYVNDILSHFSS